MFRLKNEDAIDLLVERVKVWKEDPEIIALFEDMYQKQLDAGAFEDNDLSIDAIVDDDCINYCLAYSLEDLTEKDAYMLRTAIQSCEPDISCLSLDCGRFSYIEAVDDEDEPTLFLLRV